MRTRSSSPAPRAGAQIMARSRPGQAARRQAAAITEVRQPAGGLFQSCRTVESIALRILVSNDDGYFSPGITVLAEALRQLGEVTVVAPERDRSGASNSLTLDRPLTVRRAANGYFSVNGTPTDCVHLAVTGLLDELPDVVVSGINLGANMGDDTIYSGTVAAAMEGYLLGIPSLALSLASKVGRHYDTAARIACEIVERFQRTPPAAPGLLNVNVPAVHHA